MVRLRGYQYGTVMFWYGAILVSVLIIGFLLLAVLVPNSRIGTIPIGLMCFTVLILVIKVFKFNCYSVVFSEKGVLWTCPFYQESFMAWDEIVDTGVYSFKTVGGYGVYRIVYWLYFSKVPVNYRHLPSKTEKRPKAIWNEKVLIKLEANKKAVSTALKYIPKDRIKNLDLIYDLLE